MRDLYPYTGIARFYRWALGNPLHYYENFEIIDGPDKRYMLRMKINV